MKSPMSAKAAMPSKRASISDRARPSTEPLSITLSRPLNSGLHPAPNSSRAAMRPCTVTLPTVGRRVPQMICSKVDLPEPLRPTMPRVSPRATEKSMSRKAQNSRYSGRSAPTKPCSNRSRGRPYMWKHMPSASTRTAQSVASEDIGKASAGLLEHGEAQQHRGQREQGVDAERREVRRGVEDHHGTGLLNDQGERIPGDPLAIRLTQLRGGIHHGSQEQEHRRQHAGELADVTHVHAQRGQRPADAQQEQHERSYDQRQPEGAERQRAMRHGDEADQHKDAQHGVEHRREHRYAGQYLEREHEFLREIRVAEDHGRRAREHFRDRTG